MAKTKKSTKKFARTQLKSAIATRRKNQEIKRKLDKKEQSSIERRAREKEQNKKPKLTPKPENAGITKVEHMTTDEFLNASFLDSDEDLSEVDIDDVNPPAESESEEEEEEEKDAMDIESDEESSDDELDEEALRAEIAAHQRELDELAKTYVLFLSFLFLFLLRNIFVFLFSVFFCCLLPCHVHLTHTLFSRFPFSPHPPFLSSLLLSLTAIPSSMLT